ncbi:MAG: methyltransferase domain-containing protein [Bdellovibrionales bacterium]|nr:methyltransferase domain-containing protein [Bdellovibrionales bacterium]
MAQSLLPSDSYDQVQFSSRPTPERTPSRFWVVGALRGMRPVLPSRAKFLEIGCSTGRHLLFLAELYPEAHFLGVDSSGEQIAQAVSLQRTLGLKNVEFLCSDIQNFAVQEFAYDYILCHGLYSWCSKPLQNRVFEILQHGLTETGIAYVSHNSLPGWGARQSVRDILALFDDPKLPATERVHRARQVIQGAEDLLVDAYRPHGMLLREELERNLQRSESFFIHELLAQNVSGSSLQDMSHHAAQYGMRYLGDANPQRMSQFDKRRDDLPEDFKRDTSDKRAQLLDILFPSSFRGSLWVRQSHELAEELQSELIPQTYISSPLMLETELHHDGELDSFRMTPFYGPGDNVVEVRAPALKHVLLELSHSWPTPVAFSDILRRVAKSVTFAEGEEERLREEISALFIQGVLDIYSEAIPIAKDVSEYPEVMKFAQYSHADGWVTTLRNEIFQLDSLDEKLLPLLDGKRSFDELLVSIKEGIKNGELSMQVEGKPVSERGMAETLQDELRARLEVYAEQALLRSPHHEQTL